jgi:hypothetical protein
LNGDCQGAETVGGWGVKRKSVFNGDTASVWENENILEMGGGDGCPTRQMNLMCIIKCTSAELVK